MKQIYQTVLLVLDQICLDVYEN